MALFETLILTVSSAVENQDVNNRVVIRGDESVVEVRCWREFEEDRVSGFC